MLSNKVREIVSTDLLTLDASASVWQAVEAMAGKDVGRLVVTDGGSPAGIFTERDLLRRVMSRALDLERTELRSVMTAPIQSVPLETPIVEALDRMYRGRFRHLLVHDEQGRIVAMVSMRRILRLAVELGKGQEEGRSVGDIMSRNVTALPAAASVREAVRTMLRKRTACVIALSGEKPAGIFTERDLLTRVAFKRLDIEKTPLESVMTRRLVTVPKSAGVGEVLQRMYEGDLRNMPVHDEAGELIGIVSMGEVLKFARVLDVDESVRKAWREVQEFWESEDQYTPG
jgi:CBS domain-containing protein